MPIPVDLARHLLQHALEPPQEADDARRTHVRVGPGGVPDVLIQDLRHLTETEWVTVWQSPRYRAILLATQGAGEVVFYSRQQEFQDAVREAQRGRLPPLAETRTRVRAPDYSR